MKNTVDNRRKLGKKWTLKGIKSIKIDRKLQKKKLKIGQQYDKNG